MASTESLQRTLPVNLKDLPFEEVVNTWMEPFWWDLQPTQFVSDEENQRLMAERERELKSMKQKQEGA